MKFKATFSDRGLRTLEKGFGPTLEKFGKTCQLLLGPDDVHFIQSGINTDGVHVIARLARDVLFEEDGYLIKSRCNNLIAFSFEVGSLLRVLRGASLNGADILEAKLAMRSVVVGGTGPPVSKPFLTFAARGENINIVTDLPVSTPYKAQEVEHLTQELSMAELCPFYIDVQTCVQRLQLVVEKLKSLGDTLLLAVTKGGDLHLQVERGDVQLGMELRNLAILPSEEAGKGEPITEATAEARLREILIGRDGAPHVSVQLKHIARSLQVSQLTQPAQLLCGIPENTGHVHFMFVYRDPFSNLAYDDKISLSYKLPVRDDL